MTREQMAALERDRAAREANMAEQQALLDMKNGVGAPVDNGMPNGLEGIIRAAEAGDPKAISMLNQLGAQRQQAPAQQQAAPIRPNSELAAWANQRVMSQ